MVSPDVVPAKAFRAVSRPHRKSVVVPLEVSDLMFEQALDGGVMLGDTRLELREQDDGSYLGLITTRP